MIELEVALVPCFLCGNGLAVRYSKRQKPYLVCDSCGVQTFVRGKVGIRLLSNLQNSLRNQIVRPPGDNNLELNALTNRLAELKMFLEKAVSKNWLDSLFSDKEDPVSTAIKSEIQKLEQRLTKLAAG